MYSILYCCTCTKKIRYNEFTMLLVNKFKMQYCANWENWVTRAHLIKEKFYVLIYL